MKSIAIKIKDSTGTQLNIGDTVMLQHKRNENLTFYTTIQVKDGQIYPINKFCFDRMIKVDSIPEDCKHAPATDTIAEYWINTKTELYLIDSNQLGKWLCNYIAFERLNDFFEVIEN